MTIPLSRPPVDEEIRQAVLAAIDDRQYILGPQCKALETELARHAGVRHAILTTSGTAALWMTLRALGVRPLAIEPVNDQTDARGQHRHEDERVVEKPRDRPALIQFFQFLPHQPGGDRRGPGAGVAEHARILARLGAMHGGRGVAEQPGLRIA